MSSSLYKMGCGSSNQLKASFQRREFCLLNRVGPHVAKLTLPSSLACLPCLLSHNHLGEILSICLPSPSLSSSSSSCLLFLSLPLWLSEDASRIERLQFFSGRFYFLPTAWLRLAWTRATHLKSQHCLAGASGLTEFLHLIALISWHQDSLNSLTSHKTWLL